MNLLTTLGANISHQKASNHNADHKKASTNSRRYLYFLFALSLATGLYSGSQAGLIAAKAGLAQILLDKAWRTSKSSLHPVKPWPWADTYPVGKLSVERLGESHIVLNADNGEAMAFGPASVVLPGDTSGGLSVGEACLLYTSPSPRDATLSRMPSSA